MAGVNVSTLTVSFQAQMAQFDQSVKSLHSKVDQSFGQMSKSVGTLNTALVSLGGALALKEAGGAAIKMADEYSSLTSRLKDATAATGDFNRVQQDLFVISQKNGVAMKDSVSVFQALARSSRELGASNADMIKLTDVVQKLGVIGGSSSEAMKNGLMQFSQALAGGTVHAEEFNSILENMPAVAAQMAKGMGVSMGQLRQMVKDQKLSAKEMFDALMSGAKDVEERFKQMPMTVERAWQALSNQMTKSVGEFDQATGASKALAGAIVDLSNTLGGATKAYLEWDKLMINSTLSVSKTRIGMEALIATVKNAALAAQVYGEAFGRAMAAASPQRLFSKGQFGPADGTPAQLFDQASERYKQGAITPQQSAYKLLKEQIDLQMQLNTAKAVGAAGGGAATGPDEKTLKSQRAHIADMLHDRQLETRELELQLSHQDKAKAKLEDQIKYIQSSVISEKEKTEAIKKVTALYERELQLHKFINAQKEQAKQREKSQDFLGDLKKQEEALDNQIKGHKELNKQLQNQVRLQDLLKEGNKGSAAVAQDYVEAQERIARIASKQNTADAIEQTKKLDEMTKIYGDSVGDLVRKEQEEAEALERKAKGLADLSGTQRARMELEKQTRETLQKQQEILNEINRILEKDPANVAVRQEKQKVEEAINKTYLDQSAALTSLTAATNRQEEAQREMKDQKKTLDAISHSTAGVADKIKMLDRAYQEGRVNQEQYKDTLEDLYQDGFKKAKQEADSFAKTLTGGLERALTSGKDFKQVLKDLGKELALLAARKLIFQPLEQGISNLAMGLFGPRNGVPPGYGGVGNPGGGPGIGRGTLAGGAVGGAGSLGPLSGLTGGMGALMGRLPFFAQGGFLGPGQYGVFGEAGPELAYGGQHGMSIMPMGGRLGASSFSAPPPARAFTFGMGGVTGGGQISNHDHSLIMVRLMRLQADQAAADLRSGKRQDYIQVQNLEAEAKRWENEAANSGRSQSFFTQSQFTPQWMEYNQGVKNLAAMGVNVDLESLLPESLRGQNTGAQWGGFTATPAGTSFGGGDGGGDAWGTAAPSLGPATSNFQKGSSFAGGGYNPILGPHTPGATAFSTPWNAGGGAVLGGPGGIKDLAFGGGIPIRPFTNSPISTGAYNSNPSSTIMRYAGDGRYSPDSQGRVNPIFDRDPYYGQPMYKGGAGGLLMQFADMMPVSVQSTLKNAWDGFNVINAGNPSQFTARGLGQNVAMQAAGAMLGGITSPNSMYSQMSQIMHQPWANRNMPAAAYPAVMSLFGMRRMRKGGDVRAGELVITGDGGLEAFVPKDNGKIISNDQLAAARNSGGGKVTVNLHNNAPALAEPVVTQNGDQLDVTLNAVRRDIRDGQGSRIIRSQQGAIRRR